MSVKSYRDLIAWQKAMDYVVAIYRCSTGFPKHELYGLTQQLRKAAVSIASNIAEGQARQSTKEFLQFLSIALGSLAESETQVLIAQRLEYLGDDLTRDLVTRAAEVGRIVNGLKNSLTVKE